MIYSLKAPGPAWGEPSQAEHWNLATGPKGDIALNSTPLHKPSCYMVSWCILLYIDWVALDLLRYFFCNTSSEGGLLQPPPWIFYTECLIPLYLLPVYRYWPPLSTDTKMSTIELHMTSLWRHEVSAPSQIWMYCKYTWKLAKINFSLKNRRNMGPPIPKWHPQISPYIHQKMQNRCKNNYIEVFGGTVTWAKNVVLKNLRGLQHLSLEDEG